MWPIITTDPLLGPRGDIVSQFVENCSSNLHYFHTEVFGMDLFITSELISFLFNIPRQPLAPPLKQLKNLPEEAWRVIFPEGKSESYVEEYKGWDIAKAAGHWVNWFSYINDTVLMDHSPLMSTQVVNMAIAAWMGEIVDWASIFRLYLFMEIDEHDEKNPLSKRARSVITYIYERVSAKEYMGPPMKPRNQAEAELIQKRKKKVAQEEAIADSYQKGKVKRTTSQSKVGAKRTRVVLSDGSEERVAKLPHTDNQKKEKVVATTSQVSMSLPDTQELEENMLSLQKEALVATTQHRTEVMALQTIHTTQVQEIQGLQVKLNQSNERIEELTALLQEYKLIIATVKEEKTTLRTHNDELMKEKVRWESQSSLVEGSPLGSPPLDPSLGDRSFDTLVDIPDYLGNYLALFNNPVEQPYVTWQALEWLLKDYGLSRVETRPADVVYRMKSSTNNWTMDPPLAVTKDPLWCSCPRRGRWDPAATISSVPYNWPIIDGSFTTLQGCVTAYQNFYEIHKTHRDPVCFRAAIFCAAMAKWCADWGTIINVAAFAPHHPEMQLVLKMQCLSTRHLRLLEAMAISHFISAPHPTLINEFGHTRYPAIIRFKKWQEKNNAIQRC